MPVRMRVSVCVVVCMCVDEGLEERGEEGV